MKQTILRRGFLFYALLIAAVVTLAAMSYLNFDQILVQSQKITSRHALQPTKRTSDSGDRFVTDIVQTTLKDLQDTTLKDLDHPVIKGNNNEGTKVNYDKIEVKYPPGAQSIGSPFRDVMGFTGGLRGDPHKGIDIGEEKGVPVIAAADGEAYPILDPDSNPGNRVRITHFAPSRYVEIFSKAQVIRPFEIETRYLHLDEILIPGKSTKVKRGDRKSTRLNSSHSQQSRMPSSA